MVQKTRPALVIGLGGTGQWILTFLKKDLLESNYGVMPENVRLLAFDTIAQPQARDQSAVNQLEKDVRVGSIELEPNREFIHLCADDPDVWPWAEDIVQRKMHNHISPWFKAETLMHALRRADFHLSTGAGRIRQFGRMAIFNDLSQPSNSALWTRIDNELGNLSNIGQNNKLEVIITSSFAGGTGAGMFIDIAILFRAIATSRFADNVAVRGFFVLPGAFGLGGQDDEALMRQARAFAAWRELDRFMIKSPSFGVRSMQYHENYPQLERIDIRSRAFDACYLVDGTRAHNALADVPPEEGVFPSIADAISAILDPTAGRHYTEHILTNLATLYLENPDKPLYSSLGTYTIKVPVFYTVEEVVHLFAIDALKKWLEPNEDAKGRVTGLATAKNAEKQPGTKGQEDALPLLRTARVVRGSVGVNATQFMAHIADVVFNEGAKNDKLVTAYARPGGAQNHLKLLSNLGDSDKAKEIRLKIQSIIDGTFADAVATSRAMKTRPEDDYRRIESAASKFLSTRFGRRLEDGTEVRGEYGDALDLCHYYQNITFRSLLALHVLNELMGGSESNPVKSRSGKLGYVYDTCNALVEHFDKYLEFLRAVESKRQEGGAAQRIYKSYDDAQKEMREKANAKWFFGAVVSPEAHSTQDDFIDAGQRLADMRRDDLLILVAQETAFSLRAAAIEMRDTLAEWIRVLAVGTTNDESLYNQLRYGLEAIYSGREREKRLSRVQQLVTGAGADQIYAEDFKALKTLMGAIQWNVWDEVIEYGDREDHCFKVTCDLDIDGEKFSLDYDTGYIARTWLAIARREYGYLPAQKQIGEVLIEVYDGQGGAAKLASELDRKGEPLWKFRQGTRGALQLNNFVRVYHDDTGQNDTSPISAKVKTFYDELSKALGERRGASKLEVKLINSEDRHKMSLIRTDDCIESHNFQVWHTLRDAYISYIQIQRGVDDRVRSAQLLHTFAPESNVAEYEARYSVERDKTYEIFDPKVVTVLSDRARATLFAVTYAAGMIKEDPEEGWAWLEIPGQRPIYIYDASQEGGVFNFFKMMDSFVNYGGDIRQRESKAIPFSDLRAKAIEYIKANGYSSYREFLEYQVEGAEGTLYALLYEIYDQKQDPAYWQLAEVVRFMFEDAKKLVDGGVRR